MVVLVILGAAIVSGTIGAVIRRRRPPSGPDRSRPAGEQNVTTHAGFTNHQG